MRNPKWLSLMIGLSLVICSEQCSIGICFSWKVSLGSLTLICKVNRWNHRIFIDNQFGRAVADCLPKYCHPYHQNASIFPRLSYNEITYEVHGHIDNKVNGNWTCRHGTNLDIARVEVTVLKEHESRTESLIYYTYYSLMGFVGMIAVCASLSVLRNMCCKGTTCCCRNTWEKLLTLVTDLQKKALIGIFLLFLVLFGLPALVSVQEKEIQNTYAIAAMIVMGMALGATIGILFFQKKIRNDLHSFSAIYEEPDEAL